jgi:TatA/E family protein of Tat protein translocase
MNLGLPELLFIFVIALLIFGPRKLPEISRQIGHALAEYKRVTNSVKWKWEAEVRKLDAAPASHFESVQNRMSEPVVEQPADGTPEETGSVTSGAGSELVDSQIGNTPASTELAKDDTGTEATPSSPEAAEGSLEPNCDLLRAALQNLPELRTSSTEEKVD